MSKRAYRIFSRELKVEAVRLAEDSDQPVTQVARELGLRVNQIYKCRKQLKDKQEDAFSGKRGKSQTDKSKDAIEAGLLSSMCCFMMQPLGRDC